MPRFNVQLYFLVAGASVCRNATARQCLAAVVAVVTLATALLCTCLVAVAVDHAVGACRYASHDPWLAYTVRCTDGLWCHLLFNAGAPRVRWHSGYPQGVMFHLACSERLQAGVMFISPFHCGVTSCSCGGPTPLMSASWSSVTRNP